MTRDNERRFARFLTELDLVLSGPDGGVIDPRAQAHDISPVGFRAETHARIDEGANLQFEIALGEEDKVRGTAEIVWVSQDQWGAYVAGAKIKKISRRDKRKLRQIAYRPGFDFVRLARKAFWGFYVIVVVAALQNVLLEQPTARDLIWELMPVICGLIALGWSLLVLLG